MTKLNTRYHVHCPYVRAREYLHEVLQEASQNRLPRLLSLTAPVPGTGIEFTKEVRVVCAPGVDPMHFDEPWKVSWEPVAGGTYPTFDGQLTVRADEDYDGAILELTGEYTPPLGTAGILFDAALGQKIAKATTIRLLSNLSEEMIGRYEREEAEKKAPAQRVPHEFSQDRYH